MTTSAATQPLQPTQGLTLAEKVIEQIQVSSLGMEKAAAELKRHRTKQAEVDQLIPQVCEALIQHERVRPDQREKLAESLQDPTQVLQLMIKLAGHRNSEELAKLGHGVDANAQTKTASANQPGHYDSLTHPYVGQRTTRMKQSSQRLFQGLGLGVPTQE